MPFKTKCSRVTQANGSWETPLLAEKKVWGSDSEIELFPEVHKDLDSTLALEINKQATGRSGSGKLGALWDSK